MTRQAKQDKELSNIQGGFVKAGISLLVAVPATTGHSRIGGRLQPQQLKGVVLCSSAASCAA
jgi:hypothetical protein